jgi:xanthine/uracil permease
VMHLPDRDSQQFPSQQSWLRLPSGVDFGARFEPSVLLSLEVVLIIPVILARIVNTNRG